MMSQEGKLVILSGGGEWEIEAIHDFGDQAYATPALSGDRMYIRTRSQLYCFRSGH